MSVIGVQNDGTGLGVAGTGKRKLLGCSKTGVCFHLFTKAFLFRKELGRWTWVVPGTPNLALKNPTLHELRS